MAQAIDKVKAVFIKMLTDTAGTLIGATKTRLQGIVSFAKQTEPITDENLKLFRLDVIKALVEGGTLQASAEMYATQINRVLRHYWADTKVNGVSFREIAEKGTDINKVCAGLPKSGKGGRPEGKMPSGEETALARILKAVMDKKVDQNAECFQWAALNLDAALGLWTSAYNAEKTAAEQEAAEAMERQKQQLPKVVGGN